jgi:hypothetical protein
MQPVQRGEIISRREKPDTKGSQKKEERRKHIESSQAHGIEKQQKGDAQV